ncbi:MAG TPA: hypothetical protein VIL46_10665 [Gemmataceae bacterium]
MREDLVSFNPGDVTLRLVGERWQLWAGKVMLRDFGAAYNDALEAQRVIRELNLNRYGTVGSDRPIMEYWLHDEHAPPPGIGRRTARPFDPATLEVKSYSGMWCLCDSVQILFNFGPHEQDARRALAVCRKYGFNEVVYIGRPTPTMTYLVRNESAIGRPGPPAGSAPPLSAVRQYAEATQNALILPGIGYAGERRPVNPRRLEVRGDRREWYLAQGGEVLASFGMSQRDAYTALHALQDQRVTEICRIAGTDLCFFLSHNRLPRNLPLGLQTIRFDPGRLTVKDLGGDGDWALCEDDRPLVTLGGDERQARLALSVIRHYGFDRLFQVGNPLQKGGLRVLAKSD